MPTDHVPTPEDDPTYRVCPFEWCSEPHIDDWINDSAGDAERSHTANFPDVTAEAAGFGKWAPYLRVVETRTIRGVVFSEARVLVDERDIVPVEEFGERLSEVLAILPEWCDAAREVDDLRAETPLAYRESIDAANRSAR